MNRFALAWVVAGSLVLAQQADSGFAKLLTPADVQQITKFKVNLIPEKLGSTGQLNFILEDGNQLLMVMIGARDVYPQWKKTEGVFHADVSGVGDEAFDGPAVKNPYVLYFRKGDHSVSISSYLDLEMKPRVSQSQLRELAKIRVSRL